MLLLAFGDGILRVVGFGFGLGDLFVAGFVEGGAEANVDGKALAGASFIYAADRWNIAVIASVSYANVAKLDGFAQRRVKADPAAARQVNFSPSVRGLAADDFFLFSSRSGVSADQITGDVACGHATHANNSQQ